MIISFSGKKRSGKDTAGKIAQILLAFNSINNEDIIKYLNGSSFDNPDWKIKKWAGYLKQIVALLTNRTVEDLEIEEIKQTVMYKKWVFKNLFLKITLEFDTLEEGLKTYEKVKELYSDVYTPERIVEGLIFEEIEISIRTYLEKIGTEVGRNIHGNIWIDRLMMDYNTDLFNSTLSKWIITDTRFPNEAETVRVNKGLNIRINREIISNNQPEHLSETALDDYERFDYYIDNNGTFDNLIDRIREILTKENLINA